MLWIVPIAAGAHYARTHGLGTLRLLFGVGSRIIFAVPVPVQRLLSGGKEKEPPRPHWTSPRPSQIILGLIHVGLERKRKVQAFSWRTELSTGDAAVTTWAVGSLWAIKASLLAAARRRAFFLTPPLVSVVPDFGQSRLALELRCIFRMSVGEIIIAALSFALHSVSGRKRRG